MLPLMELAKSAAQLGGREPVQAALQQEPGPVLYVTIDRFNVQRTFTDVGNNSVVTSG